MNEARTTLALADVLEERKRQHATHGTQTLPHALDGRDRWLVEHLLWVARRRQAAGETRWPWVLLEEACEAVLAPDEERRGELVQVGAVAVQWVEAIDREAGDDERLDSFARPIIARAEEIFRRMEAEEAQGAAPGSAPTPHRQCEHHRVPWGDTWVCSICCPAPHEYAPAWQRGACAHEVAEPGCSRCEDDNRHATWDWRGVPHCLDCNRPLAAHDDGKACVVVEEDDADLPGYDANGSPA